MNLRNKRIKDGPNCIPVGLMRSFFEQAMVNTDLLRPEDLTFTAINDDSGHYSKPEVDLVWLGFAIGMRCSERMEEALNKIDPPPGTTIITDGHIKKGDWFFIDTPKGWSPCPPASYGEAINGDIVARPLHQ